MTDSIHDASPDVDGEASASQEVDAHDLLVLARVAGLPISDDRAAGLARELSNTLSAVRELDAILVDHPTLTLLTSHGFNPYEPAWPDESAGGTGINR